MTSTRVLPWLSILLAAVLPGSAFGDAGIAGLRVVSSDARGLTVEYRLPSYRVLADTTAEGIFQRLEVQGLGETGEPGRPEVPGGGTWIALPPTGAYSVQVLEQETETVDGLDLIPVYRPDFVPDAELGERPVRVFARDASVYDADGSYPGAVAEFDGEAWLRFQRVGLLRLQPVQYRPRSKRATLARRLLLRIDFEDGARGPGALTPTGLRPAPGVERGFEGIYRGAVLNYEQGRSWRAQRAVSRARLEQVGGPSGVYPGQATGNPEWKVRIDTTGVHRLDYLQLAGLGFPAGIATSALAAFVRDTTVNLQPVPWTETEIGIDVEDANGNGVFDSGDFMILPVRNWADRQQPSIAELRHGSSEMLWISYWTGQNGLRVRQEPGWLNALAPTQPASFPSFRRYERNYFYLQLPDPARFPNQDPMYWTSGFTDASPVDTLRADLMDLDAAGVDLLIRARWSGNTLSSHSVSASWASATQETPLWTGQGFPNKAELTVSQTLPASAASEGINRLRIRGSGAPSSGSGACFDWFEVTYPRFYRARNNRLEFNSANLPDTLEFVVENFTGASAPKIFAYDVTDWNDVVRLGVDPAQVEPSGGGWRVRLQGVTVMGALRQYSVGASLRTIPAGAVTAETPSMLYANGPGSADFLIVAYDPLAADCQPLVTHRTAQGVPTLLARAQDVYDEFNGGRKSQWGIRRFLRYALENWGTRFVLLVGDASEDARGELGSSGPDLLPAPLIQGPLPVSAGFEAVSADAWYATTLGPGGGPIDNLLADIVVGRWTAATPAEVQAVVAKTIAYESPPFDEPWRNRAILSADDAFSAQTTFDIGGGSSEYCFRTSEEVFGTINLRCRSLILNDAGFRDYDARPHLLADSLAHLPTFGGSACPIVRDFTSTILYVQDFTKPRLLNLLSQGAAFYNFQGHANSTVMTHEELYQSLFSIQSIDLISNFGRPWFFSGFACHLNAFAITVERSLGDGLAERMVLAPNKGAIASFASTGYELLPPKPGTNHLNVHVYRAFFEDPPYEEFAGQHGARVLIGEATILGVARMVANNGGIERRAALTYCLLGDPMVSMSFGAPRFYAEAPDADTLRSGIAYFPTLPADSVDVLVEALDESYLEELSLRVEGEVPPGAVPDSDFTMTPTFPDSSGKRYFIRYRGTPPPASHDVVFTARDRFGLTGEFRLRFEVQNALSLKGQIVRDGDAGVSDAEYLWQVRAPSQLFDTDFGLLVNGAPVSFFAQPSPADTTGRLWDIRFTPSFQPGPNLLQLDVALARGGVSRTVTLEGSASIQLATVYAFPTPFRDFTTFNFNLATDQETDVLLRVFTVSGRLVYERYSQGMVPGYYQWEWDGRDRTGHTVGFGAYVYRLVAKSGSGQETHFEGRLARAPVQPRDEETTAP